MSRHYEIRCEGQHCSTMLLRTNQDGPSADESAVASLVAFTAEHPGVHELVYLHPTGLLGDRCEKLLALSVGGLPARLCVSEDDLAADAMHCGPEIGWVQDRVAVRRSLDEPTLWGRQVA